MFKIVFLLFKLWVTKLTWPDSNNTFEEKRNLGNSLDSQELEEFPRFLGIRGISEIPRYLGISQIPRYLGYSQIAWQFDKFPENEKKNVFLTKVFFRAPVFGSKGELLGIQSYLDTFPFQHYIILRDVENLPATLSDALRQWFQLVCA